MAKSADPDKEIRVGVRARKAHTIDSARILALARFGAAGGLLTPREIKELSEAVLAAAKLRREA